MGAQRLPRDTRGQRRWAQRLSAKVTLPAMLFFIGPEESRGSFFQGVFRRAYALGAQAALAEILAELERSDDPCAGLPPHLVKSAQAAARARERKAADRAQQQIAAQPARSQRAA